MKENKKRMIVVSKYHHKTTKKILNNKIKNVKSSNHSSVTLPLSSPLSNLEHKNNVALLFPRVQHASPDEADFFTRT